MKEWEKEEWKKIREKKIIEGSFDENDKNRETVSMIGKKFSPK